MRADQIIIVLAALVLGPWSGARAAERKPNVVLILIDDFGYECVTANGGESYRTPVMDSLAATGVRFEQCHVQPLCTPTRVALMTGIGNKRNYTHFGHLDPAQKTFGSLLKDAGYATCITGKWQLSNGFEGPAHFGFDEYCLWQLTRRPGRYRNPGLEINGKLHDYTKNEYGPDLVSDYALDFITRKKDAPFFLYYPMMLTHAPYDATPDSPDYLSPKGGSHFPDMVAYTDKLIGKLVAKLDELHLRDNTLILILGDNGTGRGTPSKFKGRDVLGGKGTTTMWGTHVPAIGNWPGRFEKGKVCGDLIEAADFLPTLCEATGTPVPSELKVDGRSFLPQLRGEKGTPREWLYAWYNPDGGALAKAEFAHDAQYKLYADGRLFAVAKDDTEKSPLADAALDDGAKAAKAKLQAALKQFEGPRPAAFIKQTKPFSGETGEDAAGNKKAKGQKPPEREKPSKIDDKLAKNLELLNQWETQPEVVQTVYKAAFKVLSANITASYADLARDAEFQKVCAANNIVHLGGPMLGSVTADGARVWVRTVKPAKVEVRVTVGGAEKSFGPVESTLESDLSAVVSVSGLKPETRAPYRVLVDGQPVAVPESAAIVTAPDSTKPGKVRIAFGSCFHQWGLGNGKQADLIRSRNPDAFLIYGDIAVQDRENHVGYHRADYLMRDFFPAWQRLSAAVPVYAIWDDHDYFNNDKSGIPPGYVKADIDSVWNVWRRAWNNPMYGFGDEGKGIFLRTRIGACDVIMTDGRYFRKGPDGKTYLGEEQMKWLEAQLLDCKGPFIIVSSGTMWSDYVSDGKDSWGVFDPAGRERLFSFIEKNKIPGVLLVSGDRHGARGFRIPRPSGYAFYEFEPASLGGRYGPPAARKEWNTQLFGIDKTYAFGEFTIDAMLTDPEVTFRLISEDDKEIYKLTLKRSQLTPGKKLYEEQNHLHE